MNCRPGACVTDRNLTEGDVDAIVAKLKSQLMSDFQMSVGKGLLGWLWTWFWRLLIIAALYGVVRGQLMPERPAGKIGAAVVPKSQSFTVVPNYNTPADMLVMAERIERMNRRDGA